MTQLLRGQGLANAAGILLISTLLFSSCLAADQPTTAAWTSWDCSCSQGVLRGHSVHFSSENSDAERNIFASTTLAKKGPDGADCGYIFFYVPGLAQKASGKCRDGKPVMWLPYEYWQMAQQWSGANWGFLKMAAMRDGSDSAFGFGAEKHPVLLPALPANVPTDPAPRGSKASEL